MLELWIPSRKSLTLPPTDRPARQKTSRDSGLDAGVAGAFISPSAGRFLRSSLIRPSFFPAIRCPAPACDFVPEHSDLTAEAGIERRAARESAR
jgi:hypothetical protein